MTRAQQARLQLATAVLVLQSGRQSRGPLAALKSPRWQVRHCALTVGARESIPSLPYMHCLPSSTFQASTTISPSPSANMHMLSCCLCVFCSLQVDAAILKLHSRRVCCLAVPASSDSHVISGDKKGGVAVWNFMQVTALLGARGGCRVFVSSCCHVGAGFVGRWCVGQPVAGKVQVVQGQGARNHMKNSR